jgi:ribonuclease HII
MPAPDEAGRGAMSGLVGVALIILIGVAATQCDKKDSLKPSPGVTVTVPARLPR